MAEAQAGRITEEQPPDQIRRAAMARVAALVGDRMLAVEREFDSYLTSEIPLIEEIGRYIADSGGKRIRPALLLLAARMGERRNDRDVLFAAVFELIHTATLVHDDVIDGAGTRRGRRSVNGRWGNHVTVLLGDYLYIKSMNMALTADDLRVIKVLADITQKMIEGELIQADRLGCAQVSVEDYLDLILRKTAYLFAGCCRVGGMVAGQPEEREEALASFGRNLGMAFQITDDILDLTGSESTVGKPVGGDLREGKVTLPLIYLLAEKHPEDLRRVEAVLTEGEFSLAEQERLRQRLDESGALERARGLAREYAENAVSSLDLFPAGEIRDCLRDLPGYVLQRDR